MHLLIDTNVLLDVLLQREPWVGESSQIWQAHDEGRIDGYVMASAITDIFYVARKLIGLEGARRAVGTCLDAFEICCVDRAALERAQAMLGSDFEDNLQIACAQIEQMDAIITRDGSGFIHSSVPALTPTQALSRLG